MVIPLIRFAQHRIHHTLLTDEYDDRPERRIIQPFFKIIRTLACFQRNGMPHSTKRFGFGRHIYFGFCCRRCRCPFPIVWYSIQQYRVIIVGHKFYRKFSNTKNTHSNRKEEVCIRPHRIVSSLPSLYVCATVISQLFVLYLSSLLFIWRQCPMIKLKFIVWHANNMRLRRFDSSLKHWNISIVQLNTLAQLPPPLLTSNTFHQRRMRASTMRKISGERCSLAATTATAFARTYNIPSHAICDR